MLSYNQMKDKPTVLLSFTSLRQSEFEELAQKLAQVFQTLENEAQDNAERQRAVGGGRDVTTLETVEDRLLFILFYLKTYPLQEVLAFLFCMSQSQANYWIHWLAHLLKQTLGELGYLPERLGERLEEVLSEHETLAFVQDGCERQRQRPKDPAQQKAYYSGKKKTHTIKNHVVVHPESRRVCYLSPTVRGKKHDKKLADESHLKFPHLATLEQDTGFQGFEVESVILLQPQKKPRGGELAVSDKFINRCISSGRIVVENVIASIKRCRIVKDVIRNWKVNFDDLAMLLACGLHNLRVAHRSPTETINLVDFYFR